MLHGIVTSFWLLKTGLVYPHGIVLRNKTVEQIRLLMTQVHSGEGLCLKLMSVYKEQSRNYSSPLSAADAVLHETLEDFQGSRIH